MLVRIVEHAIKSVPDLEAFSTRISRSIHGAILKGGAPTRKVADLLHGTWLGHPLHPVLTDVTIGAWTMGVLLDAVAVLRGDRAAERAADTLIAAGVASALPTALSGLADYSTVDRPAASTATLHALLNEVNLALFVLSLVERRRGRRRLGLVYSTVAAGLTLVAAWLGGHLVYGHRVGVDASTDRDGPDDWTAVLASDALPARTPKRVQAGDASVLLYRLDGRIHALGATCSHAGGPLEEGSFDGCFVQCPWHDSVFDLRDGTVRHGPATHPQPNYEAREQDGRIEVRQVGL